MASLDFRLTVISPMFLNGADTKQPELRAASVRGQLRYWLRALLGAQFTSPKEVWRHESAILGSTEFGSRVSVRLFGTPEFDTYPMLPHREGTRENVSKGWAIKPDQQFNLQIATRPGVNIPDDLLSALQLWSLLGGMGKRSRRMMGAIDARPRANDPVWYQRPQTPQELKEAILGVLSKASISDREATEIPDFPSLHPSHSWIVIGRACPDPKEANQEFFRQILRTGRFRDQQDTFGYAKGNRRRASPIIAQVRRVGNDYYPVITAFRSKPLERGYSDILREFMKEVTRYYSGNHVWGGW